MYGVEFKYNASLLKKHCEWLKVSNNTKKTPAFCAGNIYWDMFLYIFQVSILTFYST